MNTKTRELFQIENAPAIEGLGFRRFEGEEDFPQFVEIFDACNTADGIRESTTPEQMSHLYKHLNNCVPEEDMLIAEVNGKMIAYSRVWWAEQYEGPLAYYSFGFLHPDWRGKGIGTAMLAANEARMREIARGHEPGREKVIFGWAEENQPAGHKLFQNAGYTPERYFFMMLRPLDEDLPEPQMPEGLEIRPSTEEQMRQIWEAENEAFRDHWGHVEATETDFERWTTKPDLDLSLWKVAWDGDEVAGMVLNQINSKENAKLGVKYGWTDPISVRRPWRRRGLATALIHASLQELKQRGMEYAALGVDTQNPSGALQLYERAGYQVEEHWTDYKKELVLD